MQLRAPPDHGAAPRFTALLGPGQDDAIRRLTAAPPGVRVIRAGNPLRAPLTVERILIQAGQAEAGLLSAEAAERAMRRLCQPRDGEHGVILLIAQAETLSPEALGVLSRLAQPGGGALHVVFTGSPAFAALLSHSGAGPVRQALAGQAAEAAPNPDTSTGDPGLHGPVSPAAPSQDGPGPRPRDPGPRSQPSPPSRPGPHAPAAASTDTLPVPGAAIPAAVSPARLLPTFLVVLLLCLLGAGAVLALPYVLPYLPFLPPR